MTVVPSSGGGAVGSYEGTVGLDDVGVGDVIIPRLQIAHAEAKFVDNLSLAEFDELDCIILGLVKQRIFWHADTEEGDKPLCKSPDFVHGFPTVSEDVKKDKRFPWDKSNFDPANFPADAPNALNGLVTLPCANCHFKEWENNGFNVKVPPCTEQHSYPLLYNSNIENPSEPIWTAAILTIQKTGIRPSKSYLSSFVQANQAMFTARTKITLTLNRRGTVSFSIPSFRKTGVTDDAMWQQYAEQYRQIRDFMHTPPRNQDEDPYLSEEPSSNENTPSPAAATPPPPVQPQQAPPAAAPATAAAPSAPPAPAAPASAAPAVDDGLPF